MYGLEMRSITTEHGAGDMVAITATVTDHYGREASTRKVAFQGSRHGAPGPVLMRTGTMDTFVTDAGRFGDTFGAEWVRRFFGLEGPCSYSAGAGMDTHHSDDVVTVGSGHGAVTLCGYHASVLH